MPITRVLAPHDDGRMYEAELLDQWRTSDGSWRVVVRYSTEPGFTYIRAEPADRCINPCLTDRSSVRQKRKSVPVV
jgi:hypothetical protein